MVGLEMPGASSVTTYKLEHDGTLVDPKSQSDGQVALCWIQRVHRFYYVSNTGSNTISSFRAEKKSLPSSSHRDRKSCLSAGEDPPRSGD